jgi:hypothetical protein
MSGGIFTMCIYLATDTFLPTSVVFPILFALLGAAAYAFHVVSTSVGWKWLAWFWWLGAFFTGWLALMIEDFLDPAIGMAGMFFALAAIVMAFAMRRRTVRPERREDTVSEWRPLGTGAERDWQMKQDSRDQSPVNRDH